MSSTEERNAKDDLALCDKATPGPWIVMPEKCGPDGQTVYQEESLGPICDVGDPYPRGGNHPTENMHFIAMAREALPYWIERAVAAEKKIAELIADLYERDLALQVESEALGNAEAWADKLEKALEQTFKRRGMEEFVACWKEYFLEGDSDA